MPDMKVLTEKLRRVVANVMVRGKGGGERGEGEGGKS